MKVEDRLLPYPSILSLLIDTTSFLGFSWPWPWLLGPRDKEESYSRL